jgi:hypothetical protein
MAARQARENRALTRAQPRSVCGRGRLGIRDLRSLFPAPNPQPTLNQRYGATKQEQTRSNVLLFVNLISIFRVPLAAHNGLVAGSSPAGPTMLDLPGY